MGLTERYRLVRTVASGGMAQVLEAMAQGMDGFERRVAIKRLLPQHARDGERRRMFLEEARIGSRLHHGSIVPIFDYGLIDGSEFLAMEFVDGLDALRAVSGSPAVDAMPEGIALHVLSEVAHALEYIHELSDENGRALGIVHRDVSPPNILLSWDGDVKLSDFGIALSDWRDERTAAGVVKGKLHYMAPEQALGERVSSSADVYALGATLDAILGGQAPGPAMSDEEAWSRMQQARARGISAATAELIRDCLTRDPENRPRAAEVAARAGELASRRLGRDGRGALRGWLQPLRPKALCQSALDDLMGLCLVPVGPDGARTFTVTQIWQVAQQTTIETKAETETKIDVPAALVAPPPSYRRWIGGAAVALAIAAAGLLLSPVGPLRHAASPTVAATAPAVPAIPAVPAVPAMTAPAGASTAGVAALTDATTTKPGAATKSVATATAGEAAPVLAAMRLPGAAASGIPTTPLSPHADELARTRRHAGSVAPHARFTGTAGARSVVGTRGWLRIGGAALAGARVAVDGSSVGFAPLELAVPVGAHNVTVSDASSARVLVHTTIHVGDHHTRVDPLRILR